jgi:urease accessory protein
MKKISLLSLVTLAPVLAQAHPGHGSSIGFTSGMIHPMTGLDHILAMVAVGMWAAQLGGRRLWALPAAFLCLMSAGGLIGMAGFHFPMIEAGILASVLVLGLLIAGAVRLPMWSSLALVGLFAFCHGHAHGSELPAGASGLTYGVGFVLSTALLHLAGIGLGLAVQKKLPAAAFRFAGATIAIAGLCLCWF